MKIFYDCEFHEDGETIKPISWAGVREDGKELYVIVADSHVIYNATQNPWLLRNVVKYLPIEFYGSPVGSQWRWDVRHRDHKYLVTPNIAAARIADFVLSEPDPQLWAWYGAYDHVMTAQLFGRMIDLPQGFPMHTNDLKQEADRIAQYNELANNLPELEATGGYGEHHPLHDAREVAYRFGYLQSLGVPGATV